MIKKKTIYRSDNIPYLVRYSIFNCRWFAIKIHNILSSDDDCLHDHPWRFVTFLMKGSYIEHTPDGKSKKYGRFSLLYRNLNYIHRLEIVEPVWTFVVTFKKKKKWGFFTKNGWVEWFKHSYNDGCN